MGLSLIFFPACLHVACVVQQKDARQWFAELSVDMEKVVFKIPLTEYKVEHFKVNWYLLNMSLKSYAVHHAKMIFGKNIKKHVWWEELILAV